MDARELLAQSKELRAPSFLASCVCEAFFLLDDVERGEERKWEAGVVHEYQKNKCQVIGMRIHLHS